MTTELFYLTLVISLTGLLWIPYVLDRIMQGGLMSAVGYPKNPAPQSPWAQRMMKAHANAVENLVVFAPLVLIAHGIGLSNETIGMAAIIYFWARVVHATSYVFAVPWLRTLAFVAGFAAQATIAWQLLMH